MSTQALKAAMVGGAVAKPQKTIFHFLDDPRVAKGIADVAGKYLTPERMLRLCVNAVKKTPRLLECDPQTVLGAMMTSAALGLEPNTVQQQAFLIPYKKRAKVGNDWKDVYECQFQIGARGFVTLAYRSPHISSLTAEAIHEGDRFDHLLGSETFLRYAKSLKDRGALIGAFSHVKLANGNETACVLPLQELWKIRERSETFKSLRSDLQAAANDRDKDKAQRKMDETPWIMWEDDMATKSAIKKHAKQLPIAAGDALATAAEIDSRGDAGTLNLRAMTDVEMVQAVAEGEAEAPALTDGSDSLVVGAEVFGTRERAAVESRHGHDDAPLQGHQSAGTPPQFDPDAFAARMRNAGTVDALDMLADDIREIDDAAIRVHLSQVYEQRLAQLRDPKPATATAPAARTASRTAATTRPSME